MNQSIRQMFDPMMALNEMLRDHHNHYNSSYGENEYVYQMSKLSIRLLLGHFTQNHTLTSWWRLRKGQGITPAFKVHPLGTMNIYKILWETHKIVEIF